MPSFQTLISAADLTAGLARSATTTAPNWVLLDCGFDLSDTSAGERNYTAGHLPGALYAHLDRDLSGAKTGQNGRHPLPSRQAFATTLGRWGITPNTQVVTYDNHGMPYAARAWWMLRWMGHTAVVVLDGGVKAWLDAGHTLVTTNTNTTSAPPYPTHAPAMPTVSADELQSRIGQGRLLDARGGERFRGEVEPLDTVAGHIPGAALRFFKDNLAADGRFKPAAQLRNEFGALGLDGLPAHTVVNQCGSGVTACQNLLALAHAGFGDTTLYPGSWSEWSSDPTRPMVRAGATPKA